MTIRNTALRLLPPKVWRYNTIDVAYHAPGSPVRAGHRFVLHLWRGFKLFELFLEAR